jgi:hypothetical protein
MRQKIMQSTIHKCGDKLLIELPSELSLKLGWGAGDILSVDHIENGLKIDRVKNAFDHAMEIARKGMDQYHDSLQTLAKS